MDGAQAAVIPTQIELNRSCSLWVDAAEAYRRGPQYLHGQL